MPDQHDDKTDQELIDAMPPRDGGRNDPAAQAEQYLEKVNLDEQRAALKKIQENIPSSGSSSSRG